MLPSTITTCPGPFSFPLYYSTCAVLSAVHINQIKFVIKIHLKLEQTVQVKISLPVIIAVNSFKDGMAQNIPFGKYSLCFSFWSYYSFVGPYDQFQPMKHMQKGRMLPLGCATSILLSPGPRTSIGSALLEARRGLL